MVDHGESRRGTRHGRLSAVRRSRVPVAALLGAGVVALLLLAALYLVLGSRTRVLYEADSEFGGVRVVEHRDGMRSLYIGAGRATQTSLYPDRPLHLVSPYTRVGMIGPALAAPDGRILFVGLGGGAMPTYTRHALPDAEIDVVEIDPAVIDAAERFFGFRPDERLRAHAGDGRAFIERAPPGSWDAVVLDAFSDDEVPYALTTLEFLEDVRSSLAAGGVVVSNLWTANPLHASMLATYDEVFDDVVLIHVPQRRQAILVAAMSRALDRTSLVAAAAALPREPDGFDLGPLVEAGWSMLPALHAPVLRDEPSGVARP